MTGRLGGILTVLALVAVAIALYLSAVKLSGSAPACAVISGCEAVNSSEYSTFLGIPVAILGLGAAATILAGAVLWWRRADTRGLYLAYAIGLVSLPALAWFTYLEVAVINAICLWCVTYALAIVSGWAAAAVALRGVR